ncbi:MAG: hypothetical protein K0U93_00140 [Gammaproteobacteria bacterium]|nr:hypothetical protein [Gammaproteobacteria bacterium]
MTLLSFLRTSFLRTIFLALVILPVSAVADKAPWEKFYGAFAGRGSGTVEGELTARDLQVTIAPASKGFSIQWITATRKLDGRIKRKEYTVRFVPTADPHLYSSAMRVNMFGKAVPHDPMEGEPYVWATIRDDVLTLHALVITESYGYEMQVYERRLTDVGMELTFSRVRDGERLRDVNAALVRLPQ